MPIFRVKSVKNYTGQKNLHGYARGARDKYQVCTQMQLILINSNSNKRSDCKQKVRPKLNHVLEFSGH